MVTRGLGGCLRQPAVTASKQVAIKSQVFSLELIGCRLGSAGLALQVGQQHSQQTRDQFHRQAYHVAEATL